MSLGNDGTYLVAGCKPWNRRVFDESIRTLPGDWHWVGAREELTAEAVDAHDPRYIFFMHWSWKVPAAIVARRECVNFHMTDLPFGRGGSPLQNLILRGHRATRLSAFRMTDEIDAGPVYLKEDLSLDGTAREILERASRLSAAMIERIVRERPQPRPQHGEVVAFRRRRPEQSELPVDLGSAERVYDFIRMLDCDGYPAAFVDRGDVRLELRNARLDGDTVQAEATLIPRKEDA